MRQKELSSERDVKPAIPKVETQSTEKKHETLLHILRKKNLPADTPLPSPTELKEHINKLFSLSEQSQPSKMVNAGAGVADSASLLLAANRGNVLFGAGAVLSELIAWAKNKDTKPFSDARKEELRELERCKSIINSKLKGQLSTAGEERKNEIKKLMKETEKLFSDIEKESKKGMASASGSRLEGFVGSIGALASLPLYKPYADMVSNYIEGFIRSQPYQPPSFHPEPIIEFIRFASWATSYLIASAFLTYGVDWVYDRISRESSLQSREERKQELQERAEKLLERVSKLKP